MWYVLPWEWLLLLLSAFQNLLQFSKLMLSVKKSRVSLCAFYSLSCLNPGKVFHGHCRAGWDWHLEFSYLKLSTWHLMIINAEETLQRAVPRNNYSLLSDLVTRIYCMWLSTIESVMLMAFSLITSWFLCTPEFMLLHWWCPWTIAMWLVPKDSCCRWENNHRWQYFEDYEREATNDRCV